jgi:hypothetical protein
MWLSHESETDYLESPLVGWIEQQNKGINQGRRCKNIKFSFKDFSQQRPVLDLLELISGLLHPNIDSRFSSRDALCHNFVKFTIIPFEDDKKIYSDDGLVVAGVTIPIEGQIHVFPDLRLKFVSGKGVGVFSISGIEQGKEITLYGGRQHLPILENFYTYNVDHGHSCVDGEFTEFFTFQMIKDFHMLGALINSTMGPNNEPNRSEVNVIVGGREKKPLKMDITPQCTEPNQTVIALVVYSTRFIPPDTELAYFYDYNNSGGGHFPTIFEKTRW